MLCTEYRLACSSHGWLFSESERQRDGQCFCSTCIERDFDEATKVNHSDPRCTKLMRWHLNVTWELVTPFYLYKNDKNPSRKCSITSYATNSQPYLLGINPALGRVSTDVAGSKFEE